MLGDPNMRQCAPLQDQGSEAHARSDVENMGDAHPNTATPAPQANPRLDGVPNTHKLTLDCTINTTSGMEQRGKGNQCTRTLPVMGTQLALARFPPRCDARAASTQAIQNTCSGCRVLLLREEVEESHSQLRLRVSMTCFVVTLW